MMAKNRKRERGFTLIEMTTAVVLAGILAVVVTPKITGVIAALRVNDAAQKMLSDIRYMRELAISQRQTHGIEYDLTGNFYRVFRMNSGSKVYINSPYTNKPMTVDYDLLVEFDGVVISGDNRAEVRVSGLGVPLDSSDNPLTANATVTLQSSGRQRTITIFPQTGFARIT